jgi:hypothetical protein
MANLWEIHDLQFTDLFLPPGRILLQSIPEHSVSKRNHVYSLSVRVQSIVLAPSVEPAIYLINPRPRVRSVLLRLEVRLCFAQALS